MAANNVTEELPELKISIGLVTYNRPEFLREAVLSVLHQTFGNFELIISNDYLEVPVTFSSLGIKDDPRIRIINQKSNLGEIRNMNFVLECAQGEWFTWLGDDDLMHPAFLDLASKAITESHSYNMVGFFSNYLAASCPDKVFPKPLKLNRCKYYDAADFLLEYTSRKSPLVGCYGVFHTNVLKSIGGIPRLGNSFGPYSDTLLPILLVEHGRLCWLNEPLIFLRTHAESLSCKSAEFSAYTSAEVDFLERLARVCANGAVRIDQNKVTANVIRWFSRDEWAVLSRESSASKFTVARKFVNYQLCVNLPRLTLGYRMNHLLFILNFLGERVISTGYARFRAALGRQNQFTRSTGR